MSLHSIRSCRDTLILYLRYAAEHTKRPVEKLDLEQFTALNVTDFLAHLERDRGNGIATRNARLAALHTLARSSPVDTTSGSPNSNASSARLRTR